MLRPALAEKKSDEDFSSFTMRMSHAQVKTEINEIMEKVSNGQVQRWERIRYLMLAINIMRYAFHHAVGQSDLVIGEAIYNWISSSKIDIDTYIAQSYDGPLEEKYYSLLYRLEEHGISAARIVKLKKTLGSFASLQFCEKYIDRPGCTAHLLELICIDKFAKDLDPERSLISEAIMAKLAANNSLSYKELVKVHRFLKMRIKELRPLSKVLCLTFNQLNIKVVCKILSSNLPEQTISRDNLVLHVNIPEQIILKDYLKYKDDLCEYLISLPVMAFDYALQEADLEGRQRKLTLLSQALDDSNTLGKFFLLPRNVTKPSLEKGTLLKIKQAYDKLDPENKFVIEQPQSIALQQSTNPQEEKSPLDFSAFYLEMNYWDIKNIIKTRASDELVEIVKIIKFALQYGDRENNAEAAFGLLQITKNNKSLDNVLMDYNNQLTINNYYSLLADLEAQGITPEKIINFKKTLYNRHFAQESLEFCKKYLVMEDFSTLFKLICGDSLNYSLGQSAVQSGVEKNYVAYADLLENLINKNLSADQLLGLLTCFMVKITDYIPGYEFQFDRGKIFLWGEIIHRNGSPDRWSYLEKRFDRLFAAAIVKCLHNEDFHKKHIDNETSKVMLNNKDRVTDYIISLPDQVKKRALLDEVDEHGTPLNKFISEQRNSSGINISGGNLYKLRVERKKMLGMDFSLGGAITSLWFRKNKNTNTNHDNTTHDQTHSNEKISAKITNNQL